MSRWQTLVGAALLFAVAASQVPCSPAWAGGSDDLPRPPAGELAPDLVAVPLPDAPAAPVADAPPAPAAPEAPSPAPAPAPVPAPAVSAPAQPAVPDCGVAAPPPPCAQAVVGSDCCGVCKDPCLRSCFTHVGGSFDVFSGLGGSIWMGWTLSKNERYSTHVEVSYTHMDQYQEFDGESNGGKLDVVRLGLLWRTDPCCDRHWTFRAGVAYFHASGQPRDIDFDFVDIPEAGDYIGGYLGLGYEWDFAGGRWSHGPEIQAMGGWEVDSGEFGFTPTVRWGLTYRW